MKKYILLLLAGVMSFPNIFAQGTSLVGVEDGVSFGTGGGYSHKGVFYNSPTSKATMKNEDRGNVDYSKLTVVSHEFVVYDEELHQEEPDRDVNQAVLFFYVYGELTITNRITQNIVDVNGYDDKMKSLSFTCFKSSDNLSTSALNSEATGKLIVRKGDEYEVSGDDVLYYFLICNLMEHYGYADEVKRGADILSVNSNAKDETGCLINKDLFYYFNDNKYYPVVYAEVNTPIGEDYEPLPGYSFKLSIDNSWNVMYADKVPENMEFPLSVTSVSFGEDITSIPLGAFSNKVSGVYVDSKNKKFFGNGSSLYLKGEDGNPETLYYLCEAATTLNIPAVCPPISNEILENHPFEMFDVAAGNSSYCTLADGKVLCRMENNVPVEVICVAYDESLYQGEDKKNVIELPASISKISDFACKNIYDDIRFYTPIYVEFNNNLPGNERVHFDHPSVSCNHSNIEGDIPSYVQLSSKASAAKYLVNAKASTPEKPQVITPSETQENIINGLAGNNGICYIDLTTCEAAQSDSKTFSSIDLAKVNRNCLLFLPEGATSDATNVVCMQADGSFVCENLELSRANGVPFQNPYPFKTKSVTITDYQIGANLAGLVLPFDFSNENVNLAVYKGFSDDCIDVTTVESVPANTPFVTRSKDGSSVTITMSSAEGITIYPTTGLSYSTDANGWCMAGTYRTITNSGYNGTTLYGFSKNALAKVNGATFKPFSGYFVKEANASEAKIRFVEDSETTGIVESNNSSKITVSDNSIIISGIQNAVVSTVSGSVLYNGPVNGTKTISVQPGVYVVNGLKVIVNN